MTKRLLGSLAICAALFASEARVPASNDVLQFVFTSDSHFGLIKKVFRGQTLVDAATVNQALANTINALPSATLPRDGGLGSGNRVGAIDFVMHGGDVANRQDIGDYGQIQPASVSWAQFEQIYVRGLHLIDHAGGRAPLFVVPGNHDITNAIGFYKPMTPARDAASAAGMFNLMMRPETPVTAQTYRYPQHRVLTSRTIGGVHFIFLTVWPDTAEREWIEKDLASVASTMPVILVTHDQPDTEAKHFTNPLGAHDINATDKFENLMLDPFEDGETTTPAPVREQSSLEAFFAAHPNITAYFHGNSNWNQFYDWTGPGNTVAVHAFRVDSPMKGDLSANDETKLSFQLATLDPVSRRLTVREVLWNAQRGAQGVEITWGASTTVALSPRPTAPARRF